jgi:hypothetical protein
LRNDAFDAAIRPAPKHTAVAEHLTEVKPPLIVNAQSLDQVVASRQKFKARHRANVESNAPELSNKICLHLRNSQAQ